MQNVAYRRLDQRGVQSDGERGDFPGQVVGAVTGAGPTGSHQRPGDLGDQIGLPVGRRSKRPQMARLDTVLGQRTRALQDHDRVFVEETAPAQW